MPLIPPVTPRIIIAAKSGLTRKVGNGEGQQTGAVKPKNKIRFMVAEIELRLKQELKKTPMVETNSMLLIINKLNGYYLILYANDKRKSAFFMACLNRTLVFVMVMFGVIPPRIRKK